MAKKYVTLSYDDGVTQDRRLIEILNKYNVKCTFNLNFGIFKSGFTWFNNDLEIKRVDIKEVKSLYMNHEVAAHSFDHPSLTDLDDFELKFQILEDKKGLEELIEQPVKGFAYPFGTYNQNVVKALKKYGFAYARTVDDTFDFKHPENPMMWHPTCHHNHDEIFDLIDKFDSLEEEGLFYIWGHSYEFDVDNNWDHLEKLCHRLSLINNVEFVTNGEYLMRTKSRK